MPGKRARNAHYLAYRGLDFRRACFVRYLADVTSVDDVGDRSGGAFDALPSRINRDDASRTYNVIDH